MIHILCDKNQIFKYSRNTSDWCRLTKFTSINKSNPGITNFCQKRKFKIRI